MTGLSRKSPMTFWANRNYIQQVLWCIAVPMMILVCWMFSIMAFQGIRPRQLAGSNCLSYGLLCFNLFGKFQVILLVATPMGGLALFFLLVAFIKRSVNRLALFGLSIMFLVVFMINFAFRGFAVFFTILHSAYFAIAGMAVFLRAVFMKFRKRFNFLASRTFFWYGCFRHLLLLVRSKCLEPVARYALVVGSSNYTYLRRLVK